MNTEADMILGRVVARAALESVLGAEVESHAALRVSGFDDEITKAALQELEHLLQSSKSTVIVKVGTAESIAGVPDEYLLEAGQQLTAWRNYTGSGDGTLLFDWGSPPDDQGLSAISQLDGELLLDDHQRDVIHRYLAEESWMQSGGQGDMPEYLAHGQRRIWDSVVSVDEEARSLRRLARFYLDSSQRVQKLPLQTMSHVDEALSQSLPSLGLFPDGDLFEDGGSFDARMKKNVRVSGLHQPSGSAISDEELLERIESTVFLQTHLSAIGATRESIQPVMRDMVMTVPGREQRLHKLSLSIWLELFESGSKKQGLGTRIREWIDTNVPERLADFDDLELQVRLDEGDREAAEELLTADPIAGQEAIVGLLPASLRRRAERVAFPSSISVSDPLTAILRELPQFDDEESGTISLKVEGGTHLGSCSRWLFALLYSRTLLEVQQATGIRLDLDIDPDLLDLAMPGLPDLEDPFDDQAYWAPLRISLEFDGAARRRFAWSPLSIPGAIAFGAFLHSQEVAPGQHFEESFDSFLERWNDPRDWGVPFDVCEEDSYTKRAQMLRRNHFSGFTDGVSSAALKDYLDEWGSLLSDARRDLVPANAPDIDLQSFLVCDVVNLLGGRMLMLATHPVRLRWFSSHLSRMSEKLATALTDRIRLNAENADLFFESVERASAHGTPPVLVSGNHTVLVPTREASSHEEYAPIREGGNESREWLSAVDQTAIDEMVRVVVDYVVTYPHKLDGLSLLLLDRNGDSLLPVRVAKAIRGGNPSLRFNMVVVAPEGCHHSIIQEFDEHFSNLDVDDSNILPGIQLILHSWGQDGSLDLDTLRNSVDIALAPSLFGTQVTLKESTRSSDAAIVGKYDPWMHDSAHDVPVAGQNLVREFLPSASDSLLESWSTLCVRSHRQSAVAREKISNVDYFEMQVSFDSHQDLFHALHEIAHWVVTLDSLIGRNQIDNLQNRPDIILVKPGVGKNEAYTLVVSSATGRKLVAERLSRRLVSINVVRDTEAEATASRLYSVARNIAPGAVLRSLGIGTSVNEIVGLVVTRFVVAQYFAVPVDSKALVVWISFDEQHRWFGRNFKTRADLGRFVFSLDCDGRLQVDVLVVESKFRQSYDHGLAEEQLNRTVALCSDAFRTGDDALDDHRFWLSELASAVQQTSGENLPGSELPARRQTGPSDDGFQARVIEELRSGNVLLNAVQGVAVAIAANSVDAAPGVRPLGQHQLIRVNRPELQKVIGLLCAGTDPYVAESVVVRGPGGAEPSEAAGALQSGSLGGASGGTDEDFLVNLDASVGTSVAPAVGLGEGGLEKRYNRVLDVFNLHNVAVTPPSKGLPWQEGPGFYVLRFVPDPGTTTDKLVNRRPDIFLALELPSGFDMRVVLDRGAVVFEIPKTEDEKYGVSVTSLWESCPLVGGSLMAPIGADIEGRPVEINFSSSDSPHLLVAGTTGSGKSVALDTILRGLLRYPVDQVRLLLVDPKGTELVGFEDDLHVDGPIGMDAVDALAILESAVDEMATRYRLMKARRCHKIVDFNKLVEASERLPWKVIVLDEYADLTSDPDEKKQIEALLKRLAQKARAAGIHVIVATQRPSADVISPTIRSNFPAQLALRVKTATDSRIVLDESGAEALSGRGDALLNTGHGVRRIQVAYYSDSAP